MAIVLIIGTSLRGVVSFVANSPHRQKCSKLKNIYFSEQKIIKYISGRTVTYIVTNFRKNLCYPVFVFSLLFTF